MLCPTDDGDDGEAEGRGEFASFQLYLLGQFARGCEDDGVGTVGASPFGLIEAGELGDVD